MHDFTPGQRWISDTELQLGLGTVLKVDARSVTVVFLASGETRTYARQTAPLTRVSFDIGDTILSHADWSLKVESVDVRDGLLVYRGKNDDGEAASLEENQLNNFIQLNRPGDRLLTAQIDQNKWFELRYETRQHLNRLAQSDLYGLIGCRTSLIPHQLYITHEVANRYAPRVLLADEVGLGKTIEAGLILHHQLLTERARRVLIVVPESLVHQWLVEMLRRFNLYFSIFDEKRCAAIEEDNPNANPFESEQLVLCQLDFLVTQPNRLKQAIHAGWDILVVDEAHHLQWSEQDTSPEYQCVELLAQHTKGVLLLTATPEQLGKASHFARLRLLDPDRFPNFEKFIEEETHYAPIANAVEQLFDGAALNKETHATLFDILENDNALLATLKVGDTLDEEVRTELIEQLLDRHGTGRVLFRNTRATVQGFPARHVNEYPLALPDAYANCLSAFQSAATSEAQLLLSPELLYDAMDESATHWTRIDTRVNWLVDKLKELKPEKVLVIAASADTALDLAEHLRTNTGIHAAVFHEHLSIVERDRAAAFFADHEQGSQVLICSEIGSEGRNFQFAHHLILFDMPLNPDLLEQRIGRLDRIGQRKTIQIHIPYLQNSAQHIMFRWYQQGLNAFEHTCPAGHSVFMQLHDTLIESLHQLDDGMADIDALIDETRQIHEKYNLALQQGRDRLLEYNSCRPHISEELQVRATEEEDKELLEDYMDGVFDCFGIDADIHSATSLVLTQNEYMQTPFHGLSDEGMTVTYERNTALAHEDIHYLTWEHPFVSGAMDSVIDNETGNTSMVTLPKSGLKPGNLLLEAFYIIESASSEQVQTSRYLPPQLIRLLVDQRGNSYAEKLSHTRINRSIEAIDQETAAQVIRAHGSSLKKLIQYCDAKADAMTPELVATAIANTEKMLGKEIDRLKGLAEVNPNVRQDEISFYEEQYTIIKQRLQTASARLDAVRVIITV